MGERFNHVGNDKHHLAETATPLELVHSRCDREPKGAVKAHGEVPRSVRSVRNLHHHKLVELRFALVSFDHCFDHGAHQLVERRLGILDQLRFNEVIDLLDVTFVEGDEDRTLVREILIERANTDTGNLCDSVCRDGSDALALHDPDYRVKDGLDRLPGAMLLWPAPKRGTSGFGVHGNDHEQNMSKCPYSVDKSLNVAANGN